MGLFYEYECEICGLLIESDAQGSTGAVFLYDDEVSDAAYNQGLEDPAAANNDFFVSLRAPWRIMHYDCDPVERGDLYLIDVDRIRSPENVADIQSHLAQKRYRGLFGSLWNLLPHPDRLLRVDGRCVVKQTRPLKITILQGTKRIG